MKTYHWEADAFTYDLGATAPEVGLYLSRSQYLALSFLKNKYADVAYNKFSWLVSVDGRHRSGKSIVSILLASVMDKSFWKDRERRIIYNPDKLLELFEEIAKEDHHGAAIVIDEAGAALYGGDFYEKVQKAIMKVIMIYGYLQPIIFFISPVKESIAAGIRRMFHSYFKMKRADNTCSFLTPYDIEYSTFKKKDMYKKSRMRLFGQHSILQKIIIRNPPKELYEEYARIEKIKKDEMVTAIKDDSRKEKLKKVREERDSAQDLELILNNPREYANLKSNPLAPTFSPTLIKMKLNRPSDYCRALALDATRIARERLEEKQKKKEG